MYYSAATAGIKYRVTIWQAIFGCAFTDVFFLYSNLGMSIAFSIQCINYVPLFTKHEIGSSPLDLRVAGGTAGLAESNCSLPPGL